jgi:hypothetical protein
MSECFYYGMAGVFTGWLAIEAITMLILLLGFTKFKKEMEE